MADSRLPLAAGRRGIWGSSWLPGALLDGCQLSAERIEFLFSLGNPGPEFPLGRVIFALLPEVVVHIALSRLGRIERDTNLRESLIEIIDDGHSLLSFLDGPKVG